MESAATSASILAWMVAVFAGWRWLLALIKGERRKALHYQHVGPFGDYRVPKHSRFQLNKETHNITSVIPDIEVTNAHSGGREERHYSANLKIDGITYKLMAMVDENLDKYGNRISNYSGVKERPSDMVYFQVYIGRISLDEYGYEKLLQIPITAFDDPITQITLDFLSVSRYSLLPIKVARIIFSDENPIWPKNYRVIQAA